MVRVLQVFPQMNNAGTEKVIMNLYRNMDRNKVQFDFLISKLGELDNQIRELGGEIFQIEVTNKKDYYNKLLKFFLKHKYKIIHVHTQGNMEVILRAAKDCGIKCRIIHSHNSRQDLPKIFKLLTLHRNLVIEKNATDFFACSKEAAKWLFPTKYKDAKIIYNAIDIKKFSYKEDIRNKVRKKLKIQLDERVIVNVGRLAKQKNQIRLIKIAKKLVNKNSKLKFIIVGCGPLEEKLKQEVKNKKLDNYFLFLGNRNDVNEILMASDLFVFPTLHEGLGIVIIEAQFSGLKCITSDKVPEEADIGKNLLTRIKLSSSDEKWTECIMENLNDQAYRKFINKNYEGKYNINIIARSVENFYCENF